MASYSGGLWTVPFPRNPFFIGQEECLRQIRDRLETEHTVGVVQAITGMGGIGKTQIAVEFAYRYRASYPFVFWLTADSHEQLQSDSLLHARLLALPGVEAQDPQVAIAAWRSWLAKHDNWLLVIDNADDPVIAQSFVPTDAKGHCIITSRRSQLESLGVRDAIALRLMSPDTAIQFLALRTARELGSGEERAAAGDIARELGHLPLALEQAAAYIAASGCSFAEYLGSYKRRDLSLLAAMPPAAGAYARTVASTWSLNFAELEASEPASADLLRVAAFAAPESVPDELLLSAPEELGGHIAQRLSGSDTDPLLIEDLYRPLTQYGLAIRDRTSRSFTVHRLVQAVIRAGMSREDQTLWARRTARAINAAFPPASYDKWPVCDRLLPHAKRAAQHALEFGLGFDDVGAVLNETAAFLRLRADFDGSMQMHSQSLALRKRDLPEDHIEIADSLNDTACLYADLYRLEEAESLFDQALALGRSSASKADGDSLIIHLNNAGLTKARLGKCAEAEVLLAEAEHCTANPTAAAPFVRAVVLNSLAELQLRQAQLESALENAMKALAIRDDVGNPEKTARTYFTLGEIHRRRGDAGLAKEMFDIGLSLKRQVHGSGHPELIPILTRYARLARQMLDVETEAVLSAEAEQIRNRFHLPSYREIGCKGSNPSGIADQ